MMEGMRRPDIIIYLRSATVIEQSNRKDFGTERYETIEFQRQVSQNFDEIFANENSSKVIEINSNKIIEEVANDIWIKVKELIK